MYELGWCAMLAAQFDKAADILVSSSVRSFVRPFVRPFVRTSDRPHRRPSARPVDSLPFWTRRRVPRFAPLPLTNSVSEPRCVAEASERAHDVSVFDG